MTTGAVSRGHLTRLAALVLAVACVGDTVTQPVSRELPVDLTAPAAAMAVSTTSVDFENPPYTIGVIDGQSGWSSLGAAGSGCAVYDHRVVANSYGYTSFAAQSLRMSNAVTSGCFGDQTFSKPVPVGAGETTAQDLTGSTSSARQTSFEAEWSFASTVPGAEQPGLSVVASPDRGDGARMSWIQMTDTPAGLEVNFYDYQQAVGDFVFTNVIGALSRTVPHTIKVVMEFIEGPANDVVKVFVDGAQLHTGTSWEDYFRDQEGNPTRTVNRILFRTSGAAVAATANNGFVVDNMSLRTFATAPSNADQCKKGGWQSFNNPTFKNQGDCIQYVNTGK